jgi:hypothetical protein
VLIDLFSNHTLPSSILC